MLKNFTFFEKWCAKTGNFAKKKCGLIGYFMFVIDAKIKSMPDRCPLKK